MECPGLPQPACVAPPEPPGKRLSGKTGPRARSGPEPSLRNGNGWYFALGCSFGSRRSPTPVAVRRFRSTAQLNRVVGLLLEAAQGPISRVRRAQESPDRVIER